MHPRAWAVYLGTGLAIDWYAAYVKHDGTLSHATRELFRTNTPKGRVVFVAATSAAVAWWVPHIVHWPADRLSRLS